MFDSLQPHGLYGLYGLYSPWNSPVQDTGVGSLPLLQGIFPTQGSNPGLPHCRQILYQLSHKGSPRILERVAYPFSSGSSRPRNRTGVSCIAGGFFTNWAMREAPEMNRWSTKNAEGSETILHINTITATCHCIFKKDYLISQQKQWNPENSCMTFVKWWKNFAKLEIFLGKQNDGKIKVILDK